MSHEQLLAEILLLPTDKQRELIGQVIDLLPQVEVDSEMTPELMAELEQCRQEILQNPDEGKSWEEVSAELDRLEEKKAQSEIK